MRNFIIILVLLITAAYSTQILRNSAIASGLKAIPLNKYEINKITDTNKKNRLSKAKIHLGKMLFFDPRLSINSLLSCNSCHNLALGGDDGTPTTAAHDRSINNIYLNTPTVYNAVFNEKQMWNGRFNTLEEAADKEVFTDDNISLSHDAIIDRINSMQGYNRLFKKAFNEIASKENIRKAIASFERTLVTPSPLDAFLLGEDNSITKSEKRGLAQFIQKGCVSCHNGYGLGGSMKPSAFPAETEAPEINKFYSDENNLTKVPTLRNITQTAPYFHNGSVNTLFEAVAIMAKNQLGIELSNNEIEDIVSFLGALKGKKPKIVYPVLPDEVN